VYRIIAAASLNGVIGQNNELPWGHDYPEDLKFFKEKTQGTIVVMGRKTFESIGKALPNRRNIVITSRALADTNIETRPSLYEALKICDGTTWIIGGAQVYQEALQYVDELYITTIPKIITGNGLVYMPYVNPDMFLQNDEHIELSKDKKLYVNVFEKHDYQGFRKS
jgi:dihydrofolate reductase